MQLVWKKEVTSYIKASVYFHQWQREVYSMHVTAHDVLRPSATCHVSRVPCTWSRNGEVLSQHGDRAASLSRAGLPPATCLGGAATRMNVQLVSQKKLSGLKTRI